MWKTSFCLLLFSCGGPAPIASYFNPEPTQRSQEELAILALVNDPWVGVEELDHGVHLDVRAAETLVARRPFESLAEVDAVPYVGEQALQRLHAYALEHGYSSSYEPQLLETLPSRSDVRFDELALRAALTEARIDDAGAVLTRAMLRFDDGDRVLDFSELSQAALSCRDDLWKIDGYRFAESAVAQVMEAFAIEDRLALLADAVEQDDGNGYLTRRELERARLHQT